MAGQKIYNSIAFDLIRDVNFCVLVYDITQPETFESLQSWYEGIWEENGRDIPGVLIGNKTDLERPQVGTEDGQSLAQSLGLDFMEITAQKVQEVEEPFKIIANKWYQAYEERVN